MMILVLVLTALIVFVAVFGDNLLTEVHNPVYKALVDSCTHGSIGLVSWAVIISNCYSIRNLNYDHCVEIVFCGFISSLIDIDHFIAARSLRLKDAIKLGKRPPFHSTSLLIIVFIILNILAKMRKSDLLLRMSWNIFVACASHHLRDGVRRGLWFPPFGSTPPLHHFLYLGSIAILPHLAYMLMPARLFVLKKTKYIVV